MSNLDEKLKPVLNSLAVECAFGVIDREDLPHLVGEALGQIKQAFKDTGYENYRSHATFGEPLMSGSEWTNRFINEWNSTCSAIGNISAPEGELPLLYGRIAHKAACRAAGIEENI